MPAFFSAALGVRSLVRRTWTRICNDTAIGAGQFTRISQFSVVCHGTVTLFLDRAAPAATYVCVVCETVVIDTSRVAGKRPHSNIFDDIAGAVPPCASVVEI